MFNKESRIAIYGNDGFATSVVKKVAKYAKNNISFIISETKDVLGPFETYSLNTVVSEHCNEYDVILIVEEMPFIEDKIFNLYMAGVADVYILVKESVEIFDSNNYISESAVQYFNLNEKPLMRYIEFQLVDDCNLKCKGCTHFSNICTSEDRNALQLEKLEQQMHQLKRLCDVSMIRIMGGEPLLYPHLKEAVRIVRKYFSYSRIFIVTNGLLITKLDKETCKSLIENEIYINISPYMPTLSQCEKIETFLVEKNITYFWGNGEKNIKNIQEIGEFHTCLSLKKDNINGYKTCYNKYCWFLRNNYISKCCYPLLIDLLNKKMNLRFFVDSDNDAVDFFRCDNGWALIEFLNRPIPFCGYCSTSTVKFKWEDGHSTAIASDYSYCTRVGLPSIY